MGHESKACFKKALEMAPTAGIVYYNVLLTYLHLGNVTKALQWLKKGMPYLSKTAILQLRTIHEGINAFSEFRRNPDFEATISQIQE